MSETRPRWLIALALEVPRGVYREIEDRLREEVAAAEERGRLAAAVVCKCGDELQSGDGAICGACLQPEIAEAEERGRRRGVEEAAKEVESITHEGVVSQLIAYAAKRVRDLAPRDSGKERCGWSGYTDNNIQGRCVLSAGHTCPHQLEPTTSDEET